MNNSLTRVYEGLKLLVVKCKWIVAHFQRLATLQPTNIQRPLQSTKPLAVIPPSLIKTLLWKIWEGGHRKLAIRVTNGDILGDI